MSRKNKKPNAGKKQFFNKANRIAKKSENMQSKGQLKQVVSRMSGGIQKPVKGGGKPMPNFNKNQMQSPKASTNLAKLSSKPKQESDLGTSEEDDDINEEEFKQMLEKDDESDSCFDEDASDDDSEASVQEEQQFKKAVENCAASNRFQPGMKRKLPDSPEKNEKPKVAPAVTEKNVKRACLSEAVVTKPAVDFKSDKKSLANEVLRRTTEVTSKTVYLVPVPENFNFKILKTLSPKAVSCRRSINKKNKKVRNYVFVEYSDPSDAVAEQRALNGRLLADKSLIAQPAHHTLFAGSNANEKTVGALVDRINWKRLFVTGLSPTCTKADLNGVFAKCSGIELPVDEQGQILGFAHVLFANEEVALEVFRDVHGRQLKGVNLCVNYDVNHIYKEKEKSTKPTSNAQAAALLLKRPDQKTATQQQQNVAAVAKSDKKQVIVETKGKAVVKAIEQEDDSDENDAAAQNGGTDELLLQSKTLSRNQRKRLRKKLQLEAEASGRSGTPDQKSTPTSASATHAGAINQKHAQQQAIAIGDSKAENLTLSAKKSDQATAKPPSLANLIANHKSANKTADNQSIDLDDNDDNEEEDDEDEEEDDEDDEDDELELEEDDEDEDDEEDVDDDDDEDEDDDDDDEDEDDDDEDEDDDDDSNDGETTPQKGLHPLAKKGAKTNTAFADPEAEEDNDEGSTSSSEADVEEIETNLKAVMNAHRQSSKAMKSTGPKQHRPPFRPKQLSVPGKKFKR